MIEPEPLCECGHPRDAHESIDGECRECDCEQYLPPINRRCERCGRLVFQTPESFSGLLDSVIFTKTVLRFPCHGVMPKICESCWRVEKWQKAKGGR